MKNIHNCIIAVVEEIVQGLETKKSLIHIWLSQTLLAFHGDCVTAYNSKKLIWDEDKEYTNIFSDQLTAEHIIFVYSLGRAIDEFKINLKNKKEQRTDIEDDELNF